MQIEHHILTDAKRCPSPNCDARPNLEDISLIVIHNISLPPGHFGKMYIHQLFQNRLCSHHPYFKEIKNLKVSAHLLIDRFGTITQFVPFHQRAWHAGRSSWQGRLDCNDFSIGIELEGTDTIPYTAMQYTQLIRITALLLKTYTQLTHKTITGHEHIAPGRKTDPGPAFNWSFYRQQIQNVMIQGR